MKYVQLCKKHWAVAPLYQIFVSLFSLKNSNQLILLLEKLLTIDHLSPATLTQLNLVFSFPNKNAEVSLLLLLLLLYFWILHILKHYRKQIKRFNKFNSFSQRRGGVCSFFKRHTVFATLMTNIFFFLGTAQVVWNYCQRRVILVYFIKHQFKSKRLKFSSLLRNF